MRSPMKVFVGLLAAAVGVGSAESARVQIVMSLGTGAKDGATILFHQQEVRLLGVVSPTGAQPGASEARESLADLVSDKEVRCLLAPGVDVERDADRLVATCFMGELDVGERQVAKGHARDCPRISLGRYAAAEENARVLGRDLSKVFETPEDCLIR